MLSLRCYFKPLYNDALGSWFMAYYVGPVLQDVEFNVPFETQEDCAAVCVHQNM